MADNRVQQFREATKLSREELADIVGDSSDAIERYEAGEAIPPDVEEKLADTFGVSVAYLRGED